MAFQKHASGAAVGGAMFNTAKPEISRETQNLLKLMMHESKLTNLQQRNLTNNMKKGQPLPVQQRPSSKKTQSPIKSQPKVLNGRHLTLSGKRPKEVIDNMKQKQNKEIYRPIPGKLITDKDKEKLQNKMAYGENAPDLNFKARKQSNDFTNVEQQERDEFDEVLQHIEERRQFLSEMEKLGQEKKYRTSIETEISQKIRELEQIDKKRTQELEKILQEETP